jgi:NADH-quinone oxidoreductase subunit E
MSLDATLVEECARIAATYPEPAAALLPILHRVQKEEDYLSISSLEQVASLLALPPARVFGVVSFYPAFRTQQPGRHIFQVCTTLSCGLMGAGEVRACLQSRLGIEVGETTADGRFTLEDVGCLASCATAPVMIVDGELHQSLTRQRIHQIVERLD